MKSLRFMIIFIILMVMSSFDKDVRKEVAFETERNCEVLRLMDIFILTGGMENDSYYHRDKLPVSTSDCSNISRNIPLFYRIIGALSGIPCGYRMYMGVWIDQKEYKSLNDWYKKYYKLISCDVVDKLITLDQIMISDSIRQRIDTYPDPITIDEYMDLRGKQFIYVSEKMDSVGRAFRKKHKIEDTSITEISDWKHSY